MIELKAKSLVAASRMVSKRLQPKFQLFTARSLFESLIQRLTQERSFTQIELRISKSLNGYLYGHIILIEGVLLNMLESAC